MDNTIFAQSIARIRVYETKLINRGKLEGMVDAQDFNEALRMLQDSQYSAYLNRASYEEGLKLALENLYKDIKKIVPVKEVVDILSLRYDSHNIKSLIKGSLSSRDVDHLIVEAGTIPASELKIMMREDNFKEIPEKIGKTIVEAISVFKNTGDPQDIDIIVDNGIYSYMLDMARESGLDYLVKFVKGMIDIINIKSFIRVKTQDRGVDFLKRVFIDGGNLNMDLFLSNINNSLDTFVKKMNFTEHDKWVKNAYDEFQKTGDIGRVEKHGDNFMIETLKATKLVSFGPEPIIAYIMARENEIRALRIILTGKKNMVKPDTIRERLRDVYV